MGSLEAENDARSPTPIFQSPEFAGRQAERQIGQRGHESNMPLGQALAFRDHRKSIVRLAMIDPTHSRDLAIASEAQSGSPHPRPRTLPHDLVRMGRRH